MSESKSPLEIIAMANKIWHEWLREGIFDEKNEKLMAESHRRYVNKHNEFAATYPLVVLYMIQQRLYSAKVFEQYLKTVVSNPWKSSMDHLTSQADYVILLEKEFGKPQADEYYEKKHKSIMTTLISDVERCKKIINEETSYLNNVSEKASDSVKKEILCKVRERIDGNE